MDINGNSCEDQSITELKDWLFERVADDNDIVVDEMQQEFAAYYDKLEVEKTSLSDEIKLPNSNCLGFSISGI